LLKKQCKKDFLLPEGNGLGMGERWGGGFFSIIRFVLEGEMIFKASKLVISLKTNGF
jgi:hypothetical protein